MNTQKVGKSSGLIMNPQKREMKVEVIPPSTEMEAKKREQK
jgi:hypothetical protein